MSDIKWGKVFGFLFLLAVVFFLLPWGKLKYRQEINPAYPITRAERGTAGSLKKNLTNHENEFLARKKAIDDKLARGGKYTPDDLKFLESGLVGLTHLDRQSTQLMELGIKGIQTSPPLVCPLNPEACKACAGALTLDFGPTEAEKLGMPKVGCWQAVVIPTTRPHYDIRTKGSVWIWLDGRQPFLDDPATVVKAGGTKSVRFMAAELGTKIWVKVGKTRKAVEETPSKLALK